MTFSRSTKNIGAVPVGVLALVSVLSGPWSAASTGPSWSSQPAWAVDDGSSQQIYSPRRRNLYREASRHESPFAPGSQNLALDLGQVFLMGDLGAKYADNIGAQVHYTYGVSDIFGFDSSLGYSEHSNGAYSLTTLLTGLRTNLSWYDKTVPYLIFGLGFYKPTMTLAATNTVVSPVLFGVHLGPGIDLELTKSLFFGASLTFHDIFGTNNPNSGLPQDIGGTYTTFYVHAGVTF